VDDDDPDPLTLRVEDILRPHYMCEACDTRPVQDSALERLIDGGMVAEALIAHVLISKFCDYLPLPRRRRSSSGSAS